MSPMSGSAPAGTPSIDSGRGSFAIFSTWLKSLKVKVSGSWAARSRAVALSARRAVITVSAIVILSGVPSDPGGSVGLSSDGVVGAGDDSTGWPGEAGLSGAVFPAPESGPTEHAAHNTVARTSGWVSGQVAAGASHLIEVRSLIVMASRSSLSHRRYRP